ncbi:MAG: transposase [Candidatus Aenigmarchaeota archaeon]|nr:transposase [Candidatus Aenigmarchaeota archaeon]
MVKLKEQRLKWALRQTEGKNRDLAAVCGITIRRFQQLKAMHRKTGELPMLNPNRRPRTALTEGQKQLIRKAHTESKIGAAVSLRLYIQKYYRVAIAHNKIHAFLLKEGIAKEDPKKQKQRTYCRYERAHSFSLGHMDYHESRAIPGKQVIVWQDDASRFILAGLECDEATTENARTVVLAAKAAAQEYASFLRELNTDKGSQFYANIQDKYGVRAVSEFEQFLEKEGITHIPSRRRHPQTNGKEERWFRTYEERRKEFSTLEAFIAWYNNRIHLGLSRKEGITPHEAITRKLQQESLLGLFLRRWDDE